MLFEIFSAIKDEQLKRKQIEEGERNEEEALDTLK